MESSKLQYTLHYKNWKMKFPFSNKMDPDMNKGNSAGQLQQGINIYILFDQVLRLFSLRQTYIQGW